MELKIEIKDEIANCFTTDGLQEFQTQSNELVQKFIREIDRVESSGREADKQEFTQVVVRDAARAFRNSSNKSKKKWWYYLLQSILPILSLIPGFIFDKENFITIVITMILLPIIAVITFILIRDN